MKIALVSPYDWSYPGGVRTHIERLAIELRQRGHRVYILTAASGVKSKTLDGGIYKFGWTAPLRMNGSVARVAMTSDRSGSLRSLLEHEQFDVVHLHEPFVSTLTLTVLKQAKELGAACIGTFHASTSKRYSVAAWAYTMTSPLLQNAFHRLDGVIAVSLAAHDHITRYFPAAYHIIPNGIDIDRFSTPTARLPQFDDGKRNVLFLARMEPRKGLRYLLKAIPKVREYIANMGLPPVRFILAGDGPEREGFTRFVERKEWPDVIFTGCISDEEKVAYYASADIYCAPSTGNESQGITLLEAMASRVPVVASDIAGYRTVIPHKAYGLLTPPRDSERLAWAISYLLQDDGMRAQLGESGYTRATLYNWQRVTDEIEQVYLEGLAHSVHHAQQEKRSRIARIYTYLEQSTRDKSELLPHPAIGMAKSSPRTIFTHPENVVE